MLNFDLKTLRSAGSGKGRPRVLGTVLVRTERRGVLLGPSSEPAGAQQRGRRKGAWVGGLRGPKRDREGVGGVQQLRP
jgi:hypothetical protein